MAQRSARRDRENQYATTCLEHAALMWTRSANSHTGPAAVRRRNEAGRMAASDHAPMDVPTFSLARTGASTDGAWIFREFSNINVLAHLPGFD